MTTIELAQKATIVANSLRMVDTSFNDFSLALEGSTSKLPFNDTPASFLSLVDLCQSVNTAMRNTLSVYHEAFRALSDSLKKPWEWKEEFSSHTLIKSEQMQQVFNVHTYTCLTKYITSLKNNQQGELRAALDESLVKPFTFVSDRLVSERVKQLQRDYNQPVDTILKLEGKPKMFLPEGIERLMYQVYFSTESMEGVFRQCAGKSEMEQYFKYIGVVDFDLIDGVLACALIKKYIREISEPIWPVELYDQLINITENFGGNLAMWKMKFRGMYNTVPDQNKTFLEYFVPLCLKIVEHKTSKMNVNNLAICVGPAVIRKSAMTEGMFSQYVFLAFTNILTAALDIFPQIQLKFIDSRIKEVCSPSSLYIDTFGKKVSKNKRGAKTPTVMRKLFSDKGLSQAKHRRSVSSLAAESISKQLIPKM
ncbi:hypothetical protein EIN_469990 [Entamoeba invadens IP1]|uniref:Rho-GAP domain-containing protein n=1 Tax=Entamoeba invadens IP1 TaxID=370355 RepID=A0A0A1TUM0_ENTIV|nr:hypothetical protein EIN_469990 [Entamoeba invadens IP1]ELP83765.1 hypothetical protein EIN_469990 [Entamoeba invadens IP1]|eukprot:XP_004183111.1 hypothetical protein EIN_469990 [Entamoeba invadens IP1]